MLRQTLQEVLDKALSGHIYVADLPNDKLYGLPEKWQANLVGDCEDFALWCRRELKEEHAIESDLIVCTTELGEHHCVLSVVGWVLDNRSAWIQSKDLMGYRWLAIGKPNGKWYDLTGEQNQ